eukprot:symbB.v1.2.032006.t1/scaffold3782.1/size50425/3
MVVPPRHTSFLASAVRMALSTAEGSPADNETMKTAHWPDSSCLTYPAFSKRDAVEVGKLKMTGPGTAHIALSDSEQFRVSVAMLINGNKPLSPVPEINASSNLLGAGDRRQRAQLPPVLEGDVPLSMSPVASSPSATSLSAEVAGLRLLETAGLPSDSESASESTASWAESAVALSAVSAHSVRRKMEPNVQMTLSEGRTKKSPRSSMLNKMNTNHTNLSRKSSRTSLGTVSSTAEVRTTESTTAEEQRSNVKQPKVTLRRKRVESLHGEITLSYVYTRVDLLAAWEHLLVDVFPGVRQTHVDDEEVVLEGIARIDGFNQRVENVILPISLQSLSFGYDFNQSLENVALPCSLQSLTFGFHFNQSLENVTLPGNLQTLTFGYDFNQSLENVTLPSSLQSLTFGFHFNQSLENVTLPGNLQTLTFGYDFNQSLENPGSLQSLTFGMNFNQSLANITLPCSLKDLTFHESLENATWPHSLQSLTFGHSFNQSLVNVTLPGSLQSLTFGFHFNQSLEKRANPGKGFSGKLTFWSLLVNAAIVAPVLGSPPPSHTFRKQLSTSIEHATPPREKRRNAWAVNVATVANDKTGKAGKTSPQPRAANSREQSIATSASVPRLPSQRLSSSNQLERFRSQRNCARHLQLALGEDAKDAFRRALLQGTHQPRCAKLGFVGPARAGKTSTLRALSGLPLRPSTAAASTARWDRGVAKYVADMVRPPGPGQGTSSASRQPCIDTLDPSVMKRMPVDLIARRLGETANGTPAQEEKTVVLEAYDFGGQDVYYAMHHLFLSDYGIYLACIDLSSLRLPTEETGPGPPGAGDDLEKDMEKSTQTWDALEWWLASIVVHAPNSPVAIVGTHDDCLPESSRPSIHAEVHERITAFCKKLPELNEQLHINEAGQLCFFPMDNSSMDGGKSAKTLQKAVEVMVSKLLQGALGKSIPLRWSHFWAVLQRASGTSNLGPLTKVDDLWKRSARYGFESMQELQNFLRHFHGLGALLHFSEVEELRDLVCLKPAWVGDAAAAVLTAKDKVFQGCVRHVAELKERGMLHMQLLTAVWRARPFARYHQQLVGLLQALDLLLAWGHDKQSQLQTPRGRQPATDVQKIYLVPSQLPLRPPREREVEEVASQDAVVLYFDFHGLLRRLLPTLIPRLLCSLSRVESGVQILSIYANFALFATSTQGQAQGDSLRSSGSRRTVSMLLVSVQCFLVIWVLMAAGGFLQQFLTLATWCNAFVTSFDCHQPFRGPAQLSSITCHQIARDTLSPGQLLSDDEVRHIHAAVRAKCLEAIAVGNLPPGRELELISALDLGTVPWSLLPIKLKERLGLPLEDKGIDSLALNLTVAVQAKDYTDGKTVPLTRLTNFHFMVRADQSPLRKLVKQMVVATNESTQLPRHWQHFSGATHRIYSAEEVDGWRKLARLEKAEEEELPELTKNDLKRWPHQIECLRCCQNFLKNASQRDFFVQMATGSGKSLVMADLLAGLGCSKRSCIIVPKLDLMEQLAQLLEHTLAWRIARVGTRWPADLSADIFVCVRNSAWQLSNLTFDLLILDEAHHYEPRPRSETTDMGEVEDEDEHVGVHAQQVLSLNSPKRLFFSATLRRNQPDFDFGLRPAIEAGVIKDYNVMVPVLTPGDPRPSLVRLVMNLPLARKVLAFCNTVQEAKDFTRMLSNAGIAAAHYNAQTGGGRRQELLQIFQRKERLGGTRVLVTVDVLSEGVDLPVADTCLFVAPRQGIRLQQCVGRVLRNHSEKIDALVIAPPVVQDAAGILVEDTELIRLVSELARADHAFQTCLAENGKPALSRVSIAMDTSVPPSTLEDAARILQVRVFRNALSCRGEGSDPWEMGFQELLAYKIEYGDVSVPTRCHRASGFNLGRWIQQQRSERRRGTLSQEKIDQLDRIGFVWDVRTQLWVQGFEELREYKAKHGDVLVPYAYKTVGGYKLGIWVKAQRVAKGLGKLSPVRIEQLEGLGFVWDVRNQLWVQGFEELREYKAKHGDVLVPQRYQTVGGYKLGIWVSLQRSGEGGGKLSPEHIEQLEGLGFVWDVRNQLWVQGFEELREYKAKHGDVLVPQRYQTIGGYKLGIWVKAQRVAKGLGKLSPVRIEQLEGLGFVWDVLNHWWAQALEELREYKVKHGDVLVPYTYKTVGGYKLGVWVSLQRSGKGKGKLSPEHIEQLEGLGFVWDVRNQLWVQGFEELREYKAKHGDVLVPYTYKTVGGYKLGVWVSLQRIGKGQGKLSPERIQKLEGLGFAWSCTKDIKRSGSDCCLKFPLSI